MREILPWRLRQMCPITGPDAADLAFARTIAQSRRVEGPSSHGRTLDPQLLHPGVERRRIQAELLRRAVGAFDLPHCCLADAEDVRALAGLQREVFAVVLRDAGGGLVRM